MNPTPPSVSSATPARTLGSPSTLFFIGVAVTFFYIASPLILPVAMGGVIATLFFPIQRRLIQKGLSQSVAALLLTFLIAVFCVLPGTIIVFMGTQEVFRQIQGMHLGETSYQGQNWAEALLSSAPIRSILDRVEPWFPVPVSEIAESLQDLGKAAFSKLGEVFGRLVSFLPGMALGLLVIVVSLYFFLADGNAWIKWVRANSWFDSTQTEKILNNLRGTCQSVILASLASGLAQAMVSLILCWSVGVPQAPLVAVIVLLGSFIPVVGSAPATFGVALYEFFGVDTQKGVILLVGAVAISVLDNFVRPLFLKGSANLHPLVAFVAAFGGLSMMGFSGVFLGPIIASLFICMLGLWSKSPHDDLGGGDSI